MIPGIYSEEMKTYVHTKELTHECYKSLTQKQPGCPSVGESINQLWHTECCSALERNERSSHEDVEEA